MATPTPLKATFSGSDPVGLAEFESGDTLPDATVPVAFGKNRYVTPYALTDGATISVDASQSNNFKVTLGGNRTLANPTNLVEGMVLNFCIDQDATGGRTISFGSLYKWPGGTAPTWVTTASAKNFFSAYYDGSILRCNGAGGFA
jgi:hypothetical protein